jgi:hypothetical protein
MQYVRRKMKTRRRVKRAKTSMRKQRQLRNRTFRKSSRRVNRGGNGTGKRSSVATMENNWQKDTRTAKEKAEQNAIEGEKDNQNALKRVANIRSNMYLEPEVRGVRVNQTKKLKITEDQLRLMDDINAEEVPGGVEGGIWFGGKKKRRKSA